MLHPQQRLAGVFDDTYESCVKLKTGKRIYYSSDEGSEGRPNNSRKASSHVCNKLQYKSLEIHKKATESDNKIHLLFLY